CLPPADATTRSATLTFGSLPAPGTVTSLGVEKVGGGTSLRFTWSNTTNADDYVIVQDADPNGLFSVVAGSSTDGSTGLTIPMPAGSQFFLAAGRSSACGIGPKHWFVAGTAERSGP